jgi:c-di-GMP-binding flagellar brake protein YcgR
MLVQRRYERVAFYCGLQLTALPNGPTIPARSLDISVGGVGITSDTLLNRGQTVRVRFHLHNESDEWTDEDVLGRVTYSCADENENRMGIEFLETIQESTKPALAHQLNALA